MNTEITLSSWATIRKFEVRTTKTLGGKMLNDLKNKLLHIKFSNV